MIIYLELWLGGRPQFHELVTTRTEAQVKLGCFRSVAWQFNTSGSARGPIVGRRVPTVDNADNAVRRGILFDNGWFSAAFRDSTWGQTDMPILSAYIPLTISAALGRHIAYVEFGEHTINIPWSPLEI